MSLTLVTRPGGTVKGRIVFEPSQPSGTRPENVNLTFQDVSAAGELHVAEDWTFQASNMVGRGRLRATSRVLGGVPLWMLKAVLLKGADVTDTPVDFTRGVDDLEVVLTTRVTRLTGTVTDRRGASVRDATVLLFAEDPDRWVTPNRFTRAARLNQNGQFIIEALPPGRYLAAAVDALGPGDEQDPQVLERLRQSGTRLTLGEGEQRALACTASDEPIIGYTPQSAVGRPIRSITTTSIGRSARWILRPSCSCSAVTNCGSRSADKGHEAVPRRQDIVAAIRSSLRRSASDQT